MRARLRPIILLAYFFVFGGGIYAVWQYTHASHTTWGQQPAQTATTHSQSQTARTTTQTSTKDTQVAGMTSASNEPIKQTAVVQFDDDTAKQTFLANNNLKQSDVRGIALSNAFTVDRPVDSLTATPGVAVQANRRYRALLTPNDPLHPQWFSDRVALPQAWQTTTGSSAVRIAIIDTGFGLDHQDLNGRWYINPGENGDNKNTNGIDDDGNGLVDDWRGWDFESYDNNPIAGQYDPTNPGAAHGTAVAGVAAAAGNNSLGAAGVDWAARILPIQALDDGGSGYTNNIVSAINYARVMHADIINLSLGGNFDDALLRSTIQAAAADGILIIAATGNDGCDCISYPANYEQVIAVGASDENDRRADFSSYGKQLDILAPAVAVRAPLWSPANQTSWYGQSISGTSVAAPFISGVAGLFKANRPTATAAQITASLRRGADIVAGMDGQQFSSQYGYGRVNVEATVRLADAVHPDGTLIINKDSGAVYVLQNGTKRYIPSPEIFSSYYSDILRQSKEATIADLALPDGPQLEFKSGSLVKASGPGQYVLAYSSGTLQKQALPSAEVAVSLGYNLVPLITVSDGFLAGVANGPDLTAISRHSDGSLVREAGQSGVFLLTEGQRQGVPSPPVLQSFNKGKFVVLPATPADMALPLHDTPVSYQEGAVLKGSGPAIYVVDHNEVGVPYKRHIVSPFIHNLLGFTAAERQQVADQTLPVQDGGDIQ